MIQISTPTVGDSTKCGYTFSLAVLMWACGVGGRRVSIFNPRYSAPHRARARAVKRAIESKATHILWLDSDLEFPSDTLERLLAHDQPIVGASYHRRRGTGPAHTELPDADLESSLARVASLPGGCLLVQVAVYEALGQPYYRYVAETDEEDDVSEDIDFAARATAVGYDVWIDRALTAELIHLGESRLKL